MTSYLTHNWINTWSWVSCHWMVAYKRSKGYSPSPYTLKKKVLKVFFCPTRMLTRLPWFKILKFTVSTIWVKWSLFWNRKKTSLPFLSTNKSWQHFPMMTCLISKTWRDKKTWNARWKLPPQADITWLWSALPVLEKPCWPEDYRPFSLPWPSKRHWKQRKSTPSRERFKIIIP